MDILQQLQITLDDFQKLDKNQTIQLKCPRCTNFSENSKKNIEYKYITNQLQFCCYKCSLDAKKESIITKQCRGCGAEKILKEYPEQIARCNECCDKKDKLIRFGKKECRGCEKIKDLSEFYHNRKICRECKLNEFTHYRLKNIARTMIQNARKRALKRNVPFEIEISDIIIPEYCPVLGIKLEVGKEIVCDGSPSLDAIIPKLGYTKGNIMVISFRANQIKSNGTVDDHLKIVEYMRKNGCH